VYSAHRDIAEVEHGVNNAGVRTEVALWTSPGCSMDFTKRINASLNLVEAVAEIEMPLSISTSSDCHGQPRFAAHDDVRREELAPGVSERSAVSIPTQLHLC
jgi:hypothetical protein